jgi:hypothetical protein
MTRTKIEPDSPVEVLVPPRERVLVVEHTFSGPNLTERLRMAPVSGTMLAFRYTLDDLDELVGYITAEANHTEDEVLQGWLDKLFERIKDETESHDDGPYQELC